MKQILIAVSIVATCSNVAFAQTADASPAQNSTGLPSAQQRDPDQQLVERIKELEAWRDQFSSAQSGPRGTAAPAQANIAGIPVTVYGVADIYLESGNNGVNNIQRVQSGGVNGSRLGFKGEDDINDGLKAIYTVEMGVNLNDGSGYYGNLTDGQSYGGVLFGRQAWVGLEGKWGKLTAGLQYTPLFWTNVEYGLGGGLAWGNAANYFTDWSVVTELENSILYVSPKLWECVTLKSMYAFGETSQDRGQTNAGNVFNISGQFDQGPWSANLSYLTRLTETATTSDTGRWSALGAAYDFGVVKTSLLYQTERDDAVPEKSNYFEISAYLPIGQGSLLVDYGGIQNKLVDHANAQAMSLRYDYSLSKRTIVYTGISKINNEANASYGIWGATGTGLNVANGNSPRSIVLGTRVKF